MRLALALMLISTPTHAYDQAAERINRDVNSRREFTYAEKPKGYNPTRPMEAGESGNCADFAVTKCVRLVQAGYSPSRLSFYAFTRRDGADHAVCVLDGEWALDWDDNLTPLHRDNLKAATMIIDYRPPIDLKDYAR